MCNRIKTYQWSVFRILMAWLSCLSYKQIILKNYNKSFPSLPVVVSLHGRTRLLFFLFFKYSNASNASPLVYMVAEHESWISMVPSQRHRKIHLTHLSFFSFAFPLHLLRSPKVLVQNPIPASPKKIPSALRPIFSSQKICSKIRNKNVFSLSLNLVMQEKKLLMSKRVVREFVLVAVTSESQERTGCARAHAAQVLEKLFALGLSRLSHTRKQSETT